MPNPPFNPRPLDWVDPRRDAARTRLAILVETLRHWGKHLLAWDEERCEAFIRDLIGDGSDRHVAHVASSWPAYIFAPLLVPEDLRADDAEARDMFMELSPTWLEECPRRFSASWCFHWRLLWKLIATLNAWEPYPPDVEAGGGEEPDFDGLRAFLDRCISRARAARDLDPPPPEYAKLEAFVDKALLDARNHARKRWENRPSLEEFRAESAALRAKFMPDLPNPLHLPGVPDFELMAWQEHERERFAPPSADILPMSARYVAAWNYWGEHLLGWSAERCANFARDTFDRDPQAKWILHDRTPHHIAWEFLSEAMRNENETSAARCTVVRSLVDRIGALMEQWGEYPQTDPDYDPEGLRFLLIRP